MSFQIKDKFSRETPEALVAEAPEDLDNHDPVETPEGDYSADVTPPAPEAHYAPEVAAHDSGEEAPA